MAKHNALKNELSYLLEGKGANTESQRRMTQSKVQFVYQGATPWKVGSFLSGRVELFTRTEWSVAESQRAVAQVQHPEKPQSY